MNDFHIYAVDTIGHPGKSAEVSLSPYNYDYGKWAAEVIEKLGYENISCFGGSFGAGIIAKTMCVAPDKIKKFVTIQYPVKGTLTFVQNRENKISVSSSF